MAKKRPGNPNWKKGVDNRVGNRWVKGQSGNPNPASRGILVRMIREATTNGEELVAFHLDVFRGIVPAPLRNKNGDAIVGGNGKPETRLVTVTLRDRMDAADWLTERGWGKAVQPLKTYDEGSTVTRQMLRALSNSDLKVLKAIAMKAREAMARKRFAIGSGDGEPGGDGHGSAE